MKMNRSKDKSERSENKGGYGQRNIELNSSFTVPFPKERKAGMAPGCQFYMMNERHVKTASVQGRN